MTIRTEDVFHAAPRIRSCALTEYISHKMYLTHERVQGTEPPITTVIGDADRDYGNVLTPIICHQSQPSGLFRSRLLQCNPVVRKNALTRQIKREP